MIKLLALDLDGTCLRPDTSVSEATAESILKAKERGVYVVPATGRSVAIIPPEIADITDFPYYITTNGASIYERETDSILPVKSLEKEQIDALLEILGKTDCFLEFYIQENNYISEKDFKRLREFVPEVYLPLYTDRIRTVSDEELKSLIERFGVEKIEYRFPRSHSGTDDELSEKISQIPDLTVVLQAEGTNEITNSGASKGEALKKLAHHLGLAPDEVMAIGDGENDKEMLQFAGTSVVMGQAKDEIKKLADYITETNTRDGVSRAIEKFILD